MNTVSIIGSRNLKTNFFGLVKSVTNSIERKHKISVGCCIGADSFVIKSIIDKNQLQVFTAFDKNLNGKCCLSAIKEVNDFYHKGGNVIWFDDNIEINLNARLAIRTKKVINSSTDTCVAFFSGKDSKGTFLAAKFANDIGKNVFAFACGFDNIHSIVLNNLETGWQKVNGNGIWENAYEWKR